MRYKIILLFMIISYSTLVSAIDWNKCFRNVFFSGSGEGIFISTSSFFSSTGDCAMIGQREHDKKVFLAHNRDLIQADISRGCGEYIEAYAYLSGCDKIALKRLPVVFKKNFIEIYGMENTKDMKAIYDSMEVIIKSDPVLSSGCS